MFLLLTQVGTWFQSGIRVQVPMVIGITLVAFPRHRTVFAHQDHQSGSDVVVNSLRSPVPLYCLPNVHGKCAYKWQKIGHPIAEFPSTPVLYVREVGLYKCQVIVTDSTQL